MTQVLPFNHFKKKDEHREPCRNTEEVATMFGYKDAGALRSALRRGLFPEPDIQSKGVRGNRKNMWHLSTLKREKEKRDAADKAGTVCQLATGNA